MDDRHPATIVLINHVLGLSLHDGWSGHIDSCPLCQQRIRELEQERARCVATQYSEPRIRQLISRYSDARQRRHRRVVWIGRLAPVLGLALLVVVAILSFGDKPSVVQESIHLKGSLVVDVFVNRNGTGILVDSKTRFRHGDEVRVAVASARQGFVSLFYRDENGIPVPILNLQNISISPHVDYVLPGSLILECTGKRETLLVYFTTIPVEWKDVSREFEYSRAIPFECEHDL